MAHDEPVKVFIVKYEWQSIETRAHVALNTVALVAGSEKGGHGIFDGASTGRAVQSSVRYGAQENFGLEHCARPVGVGGSAYTAYAG